MSSIKKASKVTPIVVSPPKHDNYINKSADLINQLRGLIITSALIGVNRLYLLKSNRLLAWPTYVINLSLVAFVFYIMSDPKLTGGYTVFLKTMSVEFVLLVISSIFFQRKKLESFFKKIDTFDKMLNIQKDIAVLCPLDRGIYLLLICVIYSTLEFILLCTYMTESFDLKILASSLGMLVHDTEQIFIVSLLTIILVRVRVVKCHVTKSFNVDAKTLDTGEELLTKIEELSKKAQLDVTTLHNAYELLHKGADELNSVISFPMIVMLLSSGLSTIMLLKNMFTTVQYNGIELEILLIVYAIIRCLKNTILVIIPCYYSSLTTNQVHGIRTILHDAIHTFHFDKIERRKLKALFQLTRDNEFAYALWGLINLNMTLPLSYTSLCTTYLVIVIQFSKFID